MDTTNEPVAWMQPDTLECGHGGNVDWEDTGCIPLYRHPSEHDLGVAEAIGFDKGYQAATAKTLTDDFIYRNHMGYLSPGGDFYAPDYPTWKQDGFTPVYREPVANTPTDEEFDKIFATGKRLGVLETEDRFRKAMNLTDREIEQIFENETGFVLDESPMALMDFARAVLKKAGE
jgi:hypothetical protein